MGGVIEVYLLAYIWEAPTMLLATALLEKLSIHKRRTTQIRENLFEAIFLAIAFHNLLNACIFNIYNANSMVVAYFSRH